MGGVIILFPQKRSLAKNEMARILDAALEIVCDEYGVGIMSSNPQIQLSSVNTDVDAVRALLTHLLRTHFPTDCVMRAERAVLLWARTTLLSDKYVGKPAHELKRDVFSALDPMFLDTTRVPTNFVLASLELRQEQLFDFELEQVIAQYNAV